MMRCSQRWAVMGLFVSLLVCGCAREKTPPVERPVEEIEAELAPAEGA